MAFRRKSLCFSVISILLCVTYGSLNDCEKPSTPPTRNDGRYIIEIPGHPKTYAPGQTYTIFLQINRRVRPQRAFKDFILTIESDDNKPSHSLGEFSFQDETEILSKISTYCPNTVIQSSEVPKTDIQVYWTAPPSGSGCVNIKATVVESKDNWFTEDGGLSKTLCEQSLQNENVQPKIIENCCACDEAKYQLEFEGMWTRNTHYRHFPRDQWKTKFSDLIGASHQLNYAFWNYEDTASDGLKELARSGDTHMLETEVKHIENVRTIIKAPGPQYPNITKPTFAIFRVDRRNHLVSFVTKIIPSPDWIVGVSNLELCRSNCTWEETSTLNLYPWDVGIDNGLQYNSSEPIFTRQPIRKITPNNPNDPRSPFYSEDGEDMKPMAKIYLTRQRIYSKTNCNSESEDDIRCSKKRWSKWTSCSTTCGTGVKVRQRLSMNRETASQCGLNFIEEASCSLKDCSDEEGESDKESSPEVQTTEADGTIDEAIEEDPSCPGNFWGPWTACSVTCGKGTKKRLRIKKPDNDDDDSDCANPHKEESCEEVDCNSEESATAFRPSSLVISEADGDVIDCKVSKWSRWSECILESDDTCGIGYHVKSRTIKIHQSNGGKPCPKTLHKYSQCAIPCPESENSQECIMSPWSNWTPCTAKCGASAVQIRTRQMLYKPPATNSCPARSETRSCHLPLACTEDGEPILN